MIGGLHDDAELDWSNSVGPDKGVYRGRREVLDLFRSFIDAWDAIQWDPEEIVEVDDARVIVVNHIRMRGRASGVEVEATAFQVWTISDGTVQKLKLYRTKADALEAAGLPDE